MSILKQKWRVVLALTFEPAGYSFKSCIMGNFFSKWQDGSNETKDRQPAADNMR